MRQGGVGQGIFSGDLRPPSPWRSLAIKMRKQGGSRSSTDRTIGALSNAEFFWLGRVWEAEFQRRFASKESVTTDA